MELIYIGKINLKLKKELLLFVLGANNVKKSLNRVKQILLNLFDVNLKNRNFALISKM
jgi:hypothetical protein